MPLGVSHLEPIPKRRESFLVVFNERRQEFQAKRYIFVGSFFLAGFYLRVQDQRFHQVGERLVTQFTPVRWK